MSYYPLSTATESGATITSFWINISAHHSATLCLWWIIHFTLHHVIGTMVSILKKYQQMCKCTRLWTKVPEHEQFPPPLEKRQATFHRFAWSSFPAFVFFVMIIDLFLGQLTAFITVFLCVVLRCNVVQISCCDTNSPAWLFQVIIFIIIDWLIDYYWLFQVNRLWLAGPSHSSTLELLKKKNPGEMWVIIHGSMDLELFKK